MTASLASTLALLRRVVGVALLATLAACAHPISMAARTVPEKSGESSPKKVVYVYTDADRAKEVITPGGGGDKVSYRPYRDFERALRAALSANFADASSVDGASNAAAIREAGASFVFVPEITTTSSSPSLVTWPPTVFTVTVAVDVLGPTGQSITRLRGFGRGTAEFDEFKSEFSLAARRAAEQAAQSLSDEIRKSPALR